jgi:poly(3-hydroxybutyrate) depolymerase
MTANRLLRVLSAAALVGTVAGCSGSSGNATPQPATAGPATAGPSASGAATPAPLPSDAAANTVAINAGGPGAGAFRADQFYTGGATYGTDVTIDMSQLTGDAPPAAVLASERYGDMSYTIPDRTGPQNVTLYFVEVYVEGAGQRLFDVQINGAMVLSNLDIFAAAGGSGRAIERTFATTADARGNVVIRFIARVQNPKINGIVVTGAGTTVTPPPPTPVPTEAAPPSNAVDAHPSSGCSKAPTMKNGTVTIQSNGNRSYILRAPDNYDPRHPYRLIVAYHWASGTSQQVASGTGATESPFYGLWDLASNSTIFVAPMGLGSGNSTGWPNQNGQDVAFTDAILAQVEAGLCIDTTRIFATGFSYGASMSYAIACARADVFRGVALYSGAQLSGCDGGTKPIAFFAAHGLNDSVLDIQRGRELRDHFVAVNGVTAQDPPEPAVGGGGHVCTTYQGGSPRYPVEWCAFDGDHTPNPHDAGQTTSWTPAQVWSFITGF